MKGHWQWVVNETCARAVGGTSWDVTLYQVGMTLQLDRLTVF
jgi:hypothetical protein